MSVEEENKALCNRRMEAMSNGDLDALDEVHAPDLAQEVKERVIKIRRAFPDYHGTNVIQLAEGDLVATRFVFYGTHLSEFEGLAPSGERLTFQGLAIDRVVDGKIVESWVEFNIYELLDRRVAQEERKRELLEQDLSVARGIQQASLPKEVPELEGWQFSPFYQPAREVGGDFYDFFELDDGRMGVVVGDATGKGMPAALVVSATCSMLRAVAKGLGSSSPGEVLERVNEVLLARIPPNTFVTCFYAIFDLESGRDRKSVV